MEKAKVSSYLTERRVEKFKELGVVKNEEFEEVEVIKCLLKVLIEEYYVLESESIQNLVRKHNLPIEGFEYLMLDQL